MVLGAAACLTGIDPEKVDALPHPTWKRQVCVTQSAHRFSYDHAYRAAGIKIVDFETREQVEAAINEETAMLAVLASTERAAARNPNVMTPQEFVALGKKKGVPVLIDAASELPPVDSLTRYIAMGADLVVISGGKGICGPQSTGILCGRQDLIAAAAMNHSPNTGIGRGMKVGKEEIVGFVVALNRYVNQNHDIVHETWNKKARFLADELKDIRGLKAEYRENAYGFSEVGLSWDRTAIPLDGKQVAAKLKAGEPRIVYYDDDRGGTIQTRTMKDGEEIFAARRLREFFLNEAPQGA
jgi:L-seryl-tRNA(Ser) seleniumtransferase